MDFQFTAEQEAFRQEIRAFLREALPECASLYHSGRDFDHSAQYHCYTWFGITARLKRMVVRHVDLACLYAALPGDTRTSPW